MSEKIFHIKPWNTGLPRTAALLIKEIHAITPELEVLFMGSAALGLPGVNDIDLDILCGRKDIATYTQKLLPLFGTPKETSPNFSAWEFRYRRMLIDVILSDPQTSHVPKQREIFEKLQTSPRLLNKYKQLKLACDGLPYAEYVKRKKTFLDGLLAN